LLAQVGVSDASARDELDQLEGELIGDELVMRQSVLGVLGTHPPPEPDPPATDPDFRSPKPLPLPLPAQERRPSSLLELG
jgi:hypothetical protein